MSDGRCPGQIIERITSTNLVADAERRETQCITVGLRFDGLCSTAFSALTSLMPGLKWLRSTLTLIFDDVDLHGRVIVEASRA